ncbi:hypothetical protein AVEN_25865-1 [Araneus ventricosus]|uniref:Uncharacterized protein n=1 Tax=Araneus ventricosus TaxID=182803 RepID=A0A4Y2VUK7_ARAVE|nr:hypothetical protein AVEN_25865-1 [Araneus ventricosus]
MFSIFTRAEVPQLNLTFLSKKSYYRYHARFHHTFHLEKSVFLPSSERSFDSGCHNFRNAYLRLDTFSFVDLQGQTPAILTSAEQVCDYTDLQAVNPLSDLAQNFIRTYIHDDKTVQQILSI